METVSVDALAEGPFLGALELIAEGICAVSGFNVSIIQIATGGDDLVGAAVGGDSPDKTRLVGWRSSLANLERQEARSIHLGELRFMPHDVLGDTPLGYEPDLAVSDHPNAWHPRDVLFSCVRDNDGRIRGVWFIDIPENGLRPTPEKLARLNEQCEHVRRAVLSAIENRELSVKLQLLDSARTLIRNLSVEQPPMELLRAAQQPLKEGLGVTAAWMVAYSETGTEVAINFESDERLRLLVSRISDYARTGSAQMWRDQMVLPVYSHTELGAGDVPASTIAAIMQDYQLGSLLVVPIGLGDQHLGVLTMGRPLGSPRWTDFEMQTARDIGVDIGRALANARSRDLKDRLVTELRDLDRYKSELIATVAHELKTPLTAILGRVETLDELELPEPVDTAVSAIDRAAQRMQGVVEDLLTLAASGNAVIDANAEPVELCDLVGDAVEQHQAMADKSGVRLHWRKDGSQPAMVRGDAKSLALVATNLIGNAVKYTQPGGLVEVTCRAGAQGGVHFTVRDTGIGISDDDQRQIFNEFFRSSNPEARELPGTGLGLAIVQRIVDAHGGTISVRSKLREGTEFSVSLP